MMKTYTPEELERMTPEQRTILYQNAIKRRENGGQAIIDAIDSSGLSLNFGSLRSEDPICMKIRDIIWSDAARKAALDGTGKGLPALAGVDPIISSELGQHYNPKDGGTVWAGYFQAEVMRHLGYLPDGQGKMPENCVAKTAMKWKSRR